MTGCWPWSHSWSKWHPHREEAKRGDFAVTACWQDRVCSKCGRMEQETLRYPSAKDPEHD